MGVLAANDINDDTLSFSIVESDDPDGDEVPPFSISGNRLVVNDTSDLDFEFGESIALTVQVTDGVFNVEAPITVNLNELESQIALSRVSIPQNTVGFSLVGTLSTPDSESESLTYRLVNATDPELSELILFSDEWLYLDDGSDQGRQICAGVRAWYEDPAALVGTQVVFVANLEPRTIRGEVSQGMVLASTSLDGAGEAQDVCVLRTDRPVPAGSRVS